MCINDKNMPFNIHCSEHNILKPEQNGRNLKTTFLKSISLNDNYYILINISMKFDSKAPIDNKQTLIHKMVCQYIK